VIRAALAMPGAAGRSPLPPVCGRARAAARSGARDVATNLALTLAKSLRAEAPCGRRTIGREPAAAAGSGCANRNRRALGSSTSFSPKLNSRASSRRCSPLCDVRERAGRSDQVNVSSFANPTGPVARGTRARRGLGRRDRVAARVDGTRRHARVLRERRGDPDRQARPHRCGPGCSRPSGAGRDSRRG